MKTETYTGGRGHKATFKELKLNTLEDTRKSYAEIIDAYAKGKTSENQARALAYLLAGYLNYWKEEKNQELEERLTELEQKYDCSKVMRA